MPLGGSRRQDSLRLLPEDGLNSSSEAHHPARTLPADIQEGKQRPTASALHAFTLGCA
jgi:hypothetical protein